MSFFYHVQCFTSTDFTLISFYSVFEFECIFLSHTCFCSSGPFNLKRIFFPSPFLLQLGSSYLFFIYNASQVEPSSLLPPLLSLPRLTWVVLTAFFSKILTPLPPLLFCYSIHCSCTFPPKNCIHIVT